MKVCILVTIRNPDLLPASLLVFDTIRIGFPTAQLLVYGNALKEPHAPIVRGQAMKVGAWYKNLNVQEKHDRWVSDMVWNHDQPIVLCDTDMIFFESVEDWKFSHPWAGFLQPEYLDPYTKAVQRTRLHTSLIFARPDEVRDRILRFEGSFGHPPDADGNMDLIRQQWHPVRTGDEVVMRFTDTGGNLYHAIGGEAFTDEQLDCYAHLHAGTWSDLLGDLDGVSMRVMHELLMKDPSTAKGMWREQADFYRRHQIQ